MTSSSRVLFVDDDALILSCFQRLLGRRFDLHCALGPQEALHALETQGPFAVVVSDMKMPGLSGLELLQKAKHLSPGVVGLVLSGNTEIDCLDDAVRSGMVYRIVQKPCPHGELTKILEEALAQHSQTAG